MKSIAICCLAAVLAAPMLATCAGQDAPDPVPAAAAARPAQWAEPIEMEGVSNLHRISPTLYRSEQPTALGMKNLEKLGIRTVINLRAFQRRRRRSEGHLAAHRAREDPDLAHR